MSRKLNGIPNNIIDSLFSTLRYEDKGYVDDWVVSVMKKHDLREAKLDVMKVEATPPHLAIKPILSNLRSVQHVIENELKANGFPSDYISEAIIEINYDPTLPAGTFYPENWEAEKTFYAKATVTDIEGNKYEMLEKAIHSFENVELE